MPEGPELHLSSRFVNRVCENRIFTGKVLKSAVHKSDEIEFEAEQYKISASSRGKEMMLFLSEIIRDDNKKSLKKASKVKSTTEPVVQILFRFGMSGKFEFTTTDDVHKHAHLQFITSSCDEDSQTADSQMVLSYVDVRRFGRWQQGADWSKERGPDPMFNYHDFRSNVVNNLSRSDFNRPICETLLNQRYFNGVGNYLRAEVLYRLGIPPFVKACSVLEGLPNEPPDYKPSKTTNETEEGDILHVCHSVMLEVVNSVGGGGYDPDRTSVNYTAFNDWLRCYCKPGMSHLLDHNGRTVWFAGPAGPMVPKEGKSRTKLSKRKLSNGINNSSTTTGSELKVVKKAVKQKGKSMKMNATKDKDKRQKIKTEISLKQDSIITPLRRSSRNSR